MRNLTDVVDSVKQITGSDYKTAKALGIETQAVSGWRGRRQFPTMKQTLGIHELTGLDLKELIIAIEYSRENERPLKQAGFASLDMLAAIAGMSLLGVGGMVYSPTLGAIAGIAGGAIYIMRSYGLMLSKTTSFKDF